MTRVFTESVVEQAAPVWLGALGYVVLQEPDIAPGMLGAEGREQNYRYMVLEGCLCQTLVRLNPDLSHADLRDTLLPKLISGQIRVADAERIADGCESKAGVLR